MAQTKKFGAFSGVFTPSILTILGVIMYLRLPWIVGQAGLYMTIGIILVAHIISVTTGMSVASIATDKRVKAGGSYYIISRSLGLPIGGTLGLALFVGLSFSVSLYLIGFAESLLGYWGFEVSKQTIRLTGTAALVLVATITFISTRLAIKTQFLIMAAIVLSLVSIFLGNHSFTPTQPLLEPLHTRAPFILLFGIFFPAVTGFEAGVSMSGDLQDPKHAIPAGTILAIVVGLVVYIGLAFFFAFTVQPGQLVNNTKVLMDISLVPQVVAAGIWGATLSSALGSILGAPRILQATSLDRITPRFFGKGYGPDNEPRHALLLTFLIAEAGILIGELDVIARIVSMFFITTYGFLNLSCAAESWASPDFRPEFKIPKTVSIIGSVTCFIVMIELDLTAMVGATIILSSVFFYLKRKELTLETGDIWEGIWSSMIRSGLHRLNQGKTHQRNWRPNIILFSGGTSARPHLIETGKWLVDKRGLLSNFDLVENPNLKKVLYRKSEQAVKEDADDFSGVFARRIECRDKYECMEVISKYYGFSGIEPNTVLMGWGQHTQNPDRFVQVLKHVVDLDYNLLLLSFDGARRFGNQKRIDVWWRGAGNNFSLALALVRYLTGTAEWHEAEIRFLTVTRESASIDALLDNMTRILAEYRVEGQVRIINNAVEKKSFREIIQTESEHADLVINGMPDIRSDDGAAYLKNTSDMLENLGAVLLVRASSFFDEIAIVEEPNREVLKEISLETEIQSSDMVLKTDGVPMALKPYLLQFFNQVRDITTALETGLFQEVYNRNRMLLGSVHEILQSSMNELEKKLISQDRQKSHRLIRKTQSDILFQIQKTVDGFCEESPGFFDKIVADRIRQLCEHISGISRDLPVSVTTVCPVETLLSVPADRFLLKMYKIYKGRLSVFTGNEVRYRVKFVMLADHCAKQIFITAYKDAIRRFAVSGYLIIQDFNHLIDTVMDSLGAIDRQHMLDDDHVFEDFFESEKQKLIDQTAAMIAQYQQELQKSISQMNRGILLRMYALARDLKKPDANFSVSAEKGTTVKWKVLIEKVFTPVAGIWADNFQHVLNLTALDLILLSFRNRLRISSHRALKDLQMDLQNSCTDKFKETEHYLTSFLEQMNADQTQKVKMPYTFKEDVDAGAIFDALKSDVNRMIESLPEDRDIVPIQSVRQMTEHPFQPVESRTLSLHRLLVFVVETELLTPMSEQISEITVMVQKGNDIGQDVTRLISLNQEDAAPEVSAMTGETAENLTSVFNIALTRVTEGREMFENLQENLENTLNQYLNNVFDALNAFSIARADKTLPHYFREKQGKNVMTRFERVVQYVRQRVVAYRIGRLYRHHTGALSMGEWKIRQNKPTPVETIRDMAEMVSPKSHVLDSLPFYYRHLFLGKPPVTRAFWLGRKTELSAAEKAVNRYKSGTGGALMIVGEQGAGKTALCRHIGTKYFNSRNVFLVNPPSGGSIDVSVFQNRLKSALQIKGAYDGLFSKLPSNSVVIFNDIELWWERSVQGFNVITHLTHIIHKYGDACFFILNAGSHAFALMNRLHRIEDFFLDIIDCSPLDPETLRDIVLLRHQATGMSFSYAGKPREALSELKLARLFVHLYQESRGNVGVMLQNWVRSIRNVKTGMLVIDDLTVPDTRVFFDLDDLHLVLAGQFYLHKRLRRDRISRIMQMPVSDAMHHVKALQRYGLVVESFRGVYELSPFVRPYLADLLIQKGIVWTPYSSIGRKPPAKSRTIETIAPYLFKISVARNQDPAIYRDRIREAALRSVWSAVNSDPRVQFLEETEDRLTFQVTAYPVLSEYGLRIESALKKEEI